MNNPLLIFFALFGHIARLALHRICPENKAKKKKVDYL
jgi:hypothetical protein